MKNTNKPKISLFVLAALPILIVSLMVPVMAQEFAEWSAPVNLGASVNTPGFDGCPFITNDGLDLFFMSNHGSSAQELYVAHRETRVSPWSNPVSLGADINTADYNEVCPALSISGQYLYFVSNRPGGCGDLDIYVSRRLSMKSFSRWSLPQNLGCEVNSTGIELSPSLFEDDDGSVYLYFSSGLRPGGLGFGDIYVSKGQSDGIFDPARPISEFNTPFNEIRPGIGRDGLEIFFDSARPASIAGSADIYTSTRAGTSFPWSPPVNLGPMVNSSAIEGGAKLSSDGTELYFMSNRPGGFGNQDIYMIRRKELLGGLE